MLNQSLFQVLTLPFIEAQTCLTKDNISKVHKKRFRQTAILSLEPRLNDTVGQARLNDTVGQARLNESIGQVWGQDVRQK